MGPTGRKIGMSKRTLQERFDDMYCPEPNSGCWLWTASVRHRYGSIRTSSTKCSSAHRVSWELHHGPIPEGICVLHRCDTPTCVNPDHLFLGTQLDNIKDRDQKGRNKKGWWFETCSKGHSFADGNTEVRADGSRRCKICAQRYRKAYNKAYWAKTKAARV